VHIDRSGFRSTHVRSGLTEGTLQPRL
jgi:hypothetical protein